MDLSESMTTKFRPSEELARRLRRSMEARPRIEWVRDELTEAIRTLDPRAAFNIWTFHRTADRWRTSPVEASAVNKERAFSHVRSLSTGLTTNYFDALRAAK